jgi:glutathione S-transferase
MYFDGPGRANLTRLAFVAGGIKFTDTRVANWPEVKADPASVPAQLFGSMPAMKHGDILLAASAATAMYAADLGGLIGASAADRALCNMLVATNEDLRVVMYKCLFGNDESKAAGLAELPASANKFLAAIERALERKSSAGPYFLGGDAPSLADLAVFDNVCSPFPGLRALGVDLAAFPKLVACADAVAASPLVAAFVASGWK